MLQTKTKLEHHLSLPVLKRAKAGDQSIKEKIRNIYFLHISERYTHRKYRWSAELRQKIVDLINHAYYDQHGKFPPVGISSVQYSNSWGYIRTSVEDLFDFPLFDFPDGLSIVLESGLVPNVNLLRDWESKQSFDTDVEEQVNADVKDYLHVESIIPEPTLITWAEYKKYAQEEIDQRKEIVVADTKRILKEKTFKELLAIVND